MRVFEQRQVDTTGGRVVNLHLRGRTGSSTAEALQQDHAGQGFNSPRLHHPSTT